jgi:autotransporter-associated beta strand protein
MKTPIRVLLAVSASLLLLVQSVLAQNSTWTNLAGGTWSAPLNWLNNSIADGAGNTADFSTLDLTANATVTLDSSRTIGNLAFGDTSPSSDWFMNAGLGVSLTLDVATGRSAIGVNNRTVTLGLPLTSAKGFAKNGAGYLNLTLGDSVSGTVLVNGGALELTSLGSILNNPGGINVYGTGTTTAGLPGYGPTTRLGALYLTGDAIVTDRLGTTAVTNRGGEILFFRAGGGNPETYTIGKVTAEPGTLTLGAAPAAGATLQITDFNRSKGGAVEFKSYYGNLGDSGDNGRVKFGTLNGGAVANDAGGLLGGWAIAYNSSAIWDSFWATYDATTGAKPWAGTYVTGIVASVSSSDNVKHNGLAETITANTTINSLISLNADQIINSGVTVTINSGGLIIGYGNHWIKGGGKLTSGLASGELFIYSYDAAPLGRDWQINAVQIVDNGATPVSLIKSGDSGVILNAANTYSGGTYVNAGNLRIYYSGNNTVSALPPGRPVTVNPGAILRLDYNDGMGYFTGNPSMVTINRGRLTTASGRHQSVGNFTLEAGTIASEAAGDGQNYIFDGTITTVPADASSIITTHQPILLRGGPANGPVTFDVADGPAAVDLLVGSVLANGGVGRLIKNGTGVMLLTNASTYIGDTTINAGTLALSGAGSLTSTSILVAANATFDGSAKSSGFTLASGQVLKGTGTVKGALTVASGATVSPGASLGTLTFATPPILQGTLAMEISKDGPLTPADKLVVNGRLVYGGTLKVTLSGISIDQLLENDIFTLFDASGGFEGSFATLDLPIVPGYSWDVSKLTVDGSIQLVVGGPVYIVSGPTASPSRVVYTGGSALLSVTASGEEPFSFWWRKDGNVLSDQTASTLALANMSLGDGGQYSVIVSNSFGAVTSSVVVVSVLDPKGMVVQELLDGANANVSLQGQGANLTSARGFAPGSTWTVNAGNSMYSANTFDLVSGTPDTLPGWPPEAASLGALYANGGDYATGIWATRALDPAALIAFGADKVFYFSFRLDNTGDTAMGVGFANGSAASAAFLGAGAHWDNQVGLDTAQDRNSLYVGDGLLNQDLAGNNDGPYAMRAHTAAGSLNGKALIVGRLTLHADGPDTLDLKQYDPGTTIDSDLGGIAWSLSYTTTDPNVTNMVATHLLLWLNGGGVGQLDAVRVGTTWYSVTGVRLASGPVEIVSGPTVAPTSTIYVGQNTTLSVVADGAEPLHYQWRRGGLDLDGANSTSYPISNASTGDNGSYDIVVTNAFGAVTSAVVVVNVIDSQPRITQQPQGFTRWIHATNLSLSVTAEGNVPLHYQWTHNGEEIAGANSPTLAFNELQASNAGTYVVSITNSAGVSNSAEVTVTVLVPAPGSYDQMVMNNGPVSYWQLEETSGTIGYDYVGQNHVNHGNVTVGVSGPRPTDFQGFDATNAAAQYNGTNSVSAGPVGLMNNRAQFTLAGWINATVLTNSAGIFGQNDAVEFAFVSTNSVRLWTPGGNYVDATLTNIAAGQWYFLAAVADGTFIKIYLNDQLVGTGGNSTANYGSSAFNFVIGGDTLGWGIPFNGEIDDVALFSHALTAGQLQEMYLAGKYGGTLPPEIVHDPEPASAYVGGSAVFQVEARGGVPLSYQWRHGDLDVADATAPVLRLTNLITANEGLYSVVVSNASGMITSATAQLTLLVPTPGTFEEAVVTNGPVAFWQLEETSGSIAYDYYGGNNATHNGVTIGVAGPESPDFPGFGAGNFAAQYDGANSYTLGPAGLMNNRPAFSLIGWFNSTTRSVGQGLFGQNDAVEFGFQDANTIQLWTPGGGVVNANVTGLVNDGQWYFLAGVADGTTISIYLNGTLIATGGTPTNNYGSSGYSFNIGGNVFGGGAVGGLAPNNGYGWNGLLDDIALFDRALSAGEVNLLYSAGKYGAATAPTITRQPSPVNVLVGGQATVSATAEGTPPLSYQWRKDGGDLDSATAPSLTLRSVTAGDTANYTVVVSNIAGLATSEVARVEVIVPAASSYAFVVATNGPFAYWPLDEPLLGTAYELWAAHNGTHGVETTVGVEGPRPPAYPGFDPTNAAVFFSGIAESCISVPPLNLNTDTVTIACWINRAGNQQAWCGLVFSRAGSTVAGLHFGEANELRYSWNDDPNTYDWNSGLVPPDGQWTFAAVVVQPTQAAIYMSVGDTLVGRTNPVAHAIEEFDGTLYLGQDSLGGRFYTGYMDEVTIFNQALSPEQLFRLYQQAQKQASLTVVKSGDSYILSWPGEATLQASDAVEGGTWNTLYTGVGPYTDTPEPGTLYRYYRLVMP